MLFEDITYETNRIHVVLIGVFGIKELFLMISFVETQSSAVNIICWLNNIKQCNVY